jgi:methylenetetrahydrofolate dehydrogenase (NADP+) / methenyltetrahydrofolate cyclohydrolase
LKAVAPHKDVDGLGVAPKFTPATAMAIDWLLVGYNVELKNKKIAIVGKGRLVGMPLAKLWQSCGYDVTICDSKTIDMAGVLRLSDIVVTATGVPRLITSDMLKQKAVVVDAGTAAEHGKIVGDLSEDIRARNDLTITPVKGGVGPLTVVALFDNVINAARLVAEAQGQKDI